MTSNRSKSRTRALTVLAGIAIACTPIVTAQPPANDNSRRPADDGKRMQSRPMLLASKAVVGTDVVSTSGDELGEVNDLLIGTKPGRVEYVVVSRGGVLGVADTLYAVPFGAFQWDDVKKNMILPISEDRISHAPKLEGKDWKFLAEQDRRDQLNEYYAIERDRLRFPYDDRDWGRRRDDAAIKKWPLLRASEIKGQTLMSDEGSELGSIEDTVIDSVSGRVAFAIVSFGGILGVGDNRVAVPWDLFDVNNDGKVFATNIDKEKVKTAPRLGSDDWKKLREGTYSRDLYRYFGRDDAWLGGMSVGSTDGAGTDSRYASYDQCYMLGKDADVKGTITRVDTTKATKDTPQVVTLTINTDDKRDVIVHMAPDSYMRELGVTPKAGDRIALHGRWCDVEGKECFIVATITPAQGSVVTLRRSDGTRVFSWR